MVRSTRLEARLEEIPAATSVVTYERMQPRRQHLGLDESLNVA